MGVKRLADEKERQKKKPGRKKKTTHSSGMYRKRITLGHDSETGKPIVRAVYGNTKEELENKIAQLRLDRGMGVAITDDKSTWRYWSATWKKLSYPDMGKSTRDMYDAASKHLSPWNDKKICQLRPIDLEAITEQMYVDGYSKRTIKSIISFARQVSRLARKNHAMMFNVSEDVKPEKDAPAEEISPITKEEEELIWGVEPLPYKNEPDKHRAEALPKARMFALTGLNCGLRREEIVVLEWERDVDFQTATLHVNHAYGYAENKPKGPKSKAGHRDIPIPEKYLLELKDWKEANKNTFLGKKYVFPGRNGVMTKQEFEHLWDTLIDAINGITVSMRISAGRKRKGPKIPIILKHDFESHQMRHTFATNCVENGIDVKSLQYLLGHSTPTMALKYVHFRSNMAEDTRKKLGAPSLNGEKQKSGESA